MPTSQPLIIIGAARSGTKLLRDVIAAHPAVAKVPYDINYIWRMGNEGLAHDEIEPGMLTASNREHIRAQFFAYAGDSHLLVEKTVSNCLRVPFVQAVLPEAQFIHLVRDGRDVIESVYRQWTASPDWRYIWQKTRTFPLRYAFGYGMKYAVGLFKKSFSQDKEHVTTWGPRYTGIDTDLIEKGVWETCALQWLACVQSALQGLSLVPTSKQICIRYEDFVQQPQIFLAQIAAFLNIDPQPYQSLSPEYNITIDNIGKGVNRIPKDQLPLVMPHLEKGLALLNYA